MISNRITTRSCKPEDGGSMALRSIGILPHHYTASQPRRSWLGSLSSLKPQISQTWWILWIIFNFETNPVLDGIYKQLFRHHSQWGSISQLLQVCKPFLRFSKRYRGIFLFNKRGSNTVARRQRVYVSHCLTCYDVQSVHWLNGPFAWNFSLRQSTLATAVIYPLCEVHEGKVVSVRLYAYFTFKLWHEFW